MSLMVRVNMSDDVNCTFKFIQADVGLDGVTYLQ